MGALTNCSNGNSFQTVIYLYFSSILVCSLDIQIDVCVFLITVELNDTRFVDKLHSNISFQKSQPDCTNKSASLSWADSHCFPLAELDCQLHHSAEASIRDEGGHAPDSVNTDAVLPQLSCKVTATFTAPGQTQRSCKLFRHKKR